MDCGTDCVGGVLKQGLSEPKLSVFMALKIFFFGFFPYLEAFKPNLNL
jgi:hypothetical protein